MTANGEAAAGFPRKRSALHTHLYTMKRREFLSSAGAAAVIPVLPLPAMAVPAATAPVNTMQVGWAALYARANNQATPALIQKWLRVGPDQANALMSELVKRNVIHTPLSGSAVAVQPMYPNGGVPGMFRKSKRVIDQAKDLVDTLLDDDQTDGSSQDRTPEHPTDDESHETS